MNIIRFTSTFKPDGKDYTKITVWNNYVRNKKFLLTLFIPTAGSIYFLMNGIGTFWWIFVILMFYPVYHLIGFLFKIKKHLKFRNPADVAKTEFTFMNNGILADRMELQKLDMIRWDNTNMVWELKDFLVLCNNEKLVLVLSKKDMQPYQLDLIRDYIREHIKNRHGKNYKKSRIF